MDTCSVLLRLWTEPDYRLAKSWFVRVVLLLSTGITHPNACKYNHFVITSPPRCDQCCFDPGVLYSSSSGYRLGPVDLRLWCSLGENKYQTLRLIWPLSYRCAQQSNSTSYTSTILRDRILSSVLAIQRCTCNCPPRSQGFCDPYISFAPFYLTLVA